MSGRRSSKICIQLIQTVTVISPFSGRSGVLCTLAGVCVLTRRRNLIGSGLRVFLLNGLLIAAGVGLPLLPGRLVRNVVLLLVQIRLLILVQIRLLILVQIGLWIGKGVKILLILLIYDIFTFFDPHSVCLLPDIAFAENHSQINIVVLREIFQLPVKFPGISLCIPHGSLKCRRVIFKARILRSAAAFKKIVAGGGKPGKYFLQG